MDGTCFVIGIPLLVQLDIDGGANEERGHGAGDGARLTGGEGQIVITPVGGTEQLTILVLGRETDHKGYLVRGIGDGCLIGIA